MRDSVYGVPRIVEVGHTQFWHFGGNNTGKNEAGFVFFRHIPIRRAAVALGGGPFYVVRSPLPLFAHEQNGARVFFFYLFPPLIVALNSGHVVQHCVCR